MADHGRDMSPDSSTHISEKNKKSRKRKHRQKSKTSHKKHKSSSKETTNTHVHKKSKKSKKRTSKSPSDESEEEIFDIKPLSGYVDDKKQLHHEIFSLVSKKEIKDLLPESLKKLKFKEFKHLCLEQLEIMSQKRLRHIIAGQEMVSSSSDESTEPQETGQHNKSTDTKSDVNIAMENKSEVAMEDPAKAVKEPQPTNISILEEMSMSPNQDELDELIEGQPSVSQKPSQPIENDEQTNTENAMTIPIPDPSLMLPEAELKELEFRARALKSFVKARERQQLEKEKAKMMSEDSSN